MLMRESRELLIALRLRAMTSAAGWNPLLGNTLFKNALPPCDGCRISSCSRYRRWSLRRIVVRQTFDLVVGQTPAQSPHVFIPGGIEAVVTAKCLHLCHEVRWLLCSEIGEVRVGRSSVDTVAKRANLLRKRRCRNFWIGQVTGILDAGAASAEHTRHNNPKNMTKFHAESPMLQGRLIREPDVQERRVVVAGIAPSTVVVGACPQEFVVARVLRANAYVLHGNIEGFIGGASGSRIALD